MTAYTAITKAMTAIQTAFNAVMAMNPIFLIVIAIVAIIAILAVLQSKFDIFGKTVEFVGNAFGTVWGFIKTVFNWVTDNWPLLLAVIMGPFALAVYGIVKFKDSIIGVLGKVKDFCCHHF